MTTPLNDNLKKHLQTIHVASAQTGYGFFNPKAPMTANLINSGHLLADHNVTDPADSSKVAMTLSPVGKEAIGISPATQGTASPAQPSFGTAAGTVVDTPATEGTQEGQETAAAKEKKLRGPRTPPVVAYTPGQRLALPEIKRGGAGTRTETYPFSQLEAPNEQGHDSFFVAATEANPNPAKSLAGTVSSATKKYKDEGRKFAIAATDNDPVTGQKGARVYRIK